MDEAEARSRKNRKKGAGVDKLVRTARLAVLSKYLGIELKRHKDPGNVTNTNPFVQGKDAAEKDSKDESVVIMKGF